MTKIGMAPAAPPPAEESDVAADRRRADLKRAIELGVLGPLAQEGVDPSIDKSEKKDAPDLDLEMPVDVPAQEEAETWEEALVKMKKQKAQRAAKPRKPKAPPNMERFIQSLLSEEGIERSRMEEGSEKRRDILEAAMKTDDPQESVVEAVEDPKPKRVVNREGLQLNPDAVPPNDGRDDVSIYDDPQAIADAADDHAAKYIYKDIPGEAVPDAASQDMAQERKENLTYQGDGPGGDGVVLFFEDPDGGNQRGYWLRDDDSTVNVTNILSPPSE